MKLPMELLAGRIEVGCAAWEERLSAEGAETTEERREINWGPEAENT